MAIITMTMLITVSLLSLRSVSIFIWLIHSRVCVCVCFHLIYLLHCQNLWNSLLAYWYFSLNLYQMELTVISGWTLFLCCCEQKLLFLGENWSLFHRETGLVCIIIPLSLLLRLNVISFRIVCVEMDCKNLKFKGKMRLIMPGKAWLCEEF